MRKNFKSFVKKGFALLMATATVMCGMPSVDTQAESVDWMLYNNGSSNSITNTVCDMRYTPHTRHYTKADLIQSSDIEAYVKINGYNVKLWDIARAQYVNFYGLADTTTIQCFSVKYRDSSDSSNKSRFYIDGTQVTAGYTMEGSIWN